MEKNTKADKPIKARKASKASKSTKMKPQEIAEILQQPLEARKALAEEAFLNGMPPKQLVKTYGLQTQAVYGMISTLVKVARKPPEPPYIVEDKKKDLEAHPETPPATQTPPATPQQTLTTNTPNPVQQNNGGSAQTNSVETRLDALTKLVAEDIRSRQPKMVVVDRGKGDDAEGEEEDSGSPFAGDGGKAESTQTVQLEMTTMGQRIVNNPKNIMYFDFAKKRWPKWGRGADFSEFVSDCIHFFMSEHNIEIEVRERIE